MPQFKSKLFYKIFSGYIIAVVVIVVLACTIIVNAVGFQELAVRSEKEILPNTLMAKDLQLHVIQVQQWLTDISATRGAEGFDDGYDEQDTARHPVSKRYGNKQHHGTDF